MANQRIVELLSVAHELRDIQWLRDSLAAAVQLELATLPPYLTAYWSIKSPTGEAASLVKSIALQEMCHMGQAANILTGIGGPPHINSQVPVYPGPLPGGVRPHLEVYLGGLSLRWLDKVAMQIEYPESGPIALFLGVTYPTIGAFYDAIESAIVALKPAFDPAKQLDVSIGTNTVKIIHDVAEATAAIRLIKLQGEGTSTTPLAGQELAHYYEFAEIFHGKKLVVDPVTKKWSYSGGPIPFPDVYPLDRVPAGGYPQATGDALAKLHLFQNTYTGVLDNLQTAWATTSPDALGAAIGAMFSLQAPAVALMKIPIPHGTGNYGPTWVYGTVH